MASIANRHQPIILPMQTVRRRIRRRRILADGCNGPTWRCPMCERSRSVPSEPYKCIPAAEARQLVERFEWHYTPKHGSWLDLAESELGVLSSQCLDRRIADKQTLI
jgi:hypothetical protein